MKSMKRKDDCQQKMYYDAIQNNIPCCKKRMPFVTLNQLLLCHINYLINRHTNFTIMIFNHMGLIPFNYLTRFINLITLLRYFRKNISPGFLDCFGCMINLKNYIFSTVYFTLLYKIIGDRHIADA
jgi:hypothetical protein